MKTALITGATGGIGGKTAEVLGQAGYEVIVTGIDEAGRDTVMSNLESKGIKAHFYKCDATSEEQVNETFAKIAEKFDHLDLLVNNVGGLGGRQRVSEMETGFMRKVMALNFDSLFFNTRAALPLLKKGTNPSIINFSRKKRIARGAGVDISEVNRLVKQFDQMKKMMKQMPGLMGGKGKFGKKGMFGKLPF